ncbi:hypothetical protein CAP31_05740 [Sulfuriferula sp. AH1]|uniref:FAD assembly factor SdhE n=1 Tax=Sulfuriferula sp. AH1 TaxID=1985873 RepID=UPI000B3B4797|nr:succinate dehydrogenase assembly factor 2 [Sulfuriferula sp. AH1]ARU31232.1 hypothetical protein CAP31_05740 [Sulfuriferula sp. AH1]
MISVNELRWRCRRGMLELDTVLTAFLETGYPRLNPVQQQAFAELLMLDDMALWDKIQHNDGIFAVLHAQSI